MPETSVKRGARRALAPPTQISTGKSLFEEILSANFSAVDRYSGGSTQLEPAHCGIVFVPRRPFDTILTYHFQPVRQVSQWAFTIPEWRMSQTGKDKRQVTFLERLLKFHLPNE